MLDERTDTRWLRLQHEPLDVGAAYEALRHPAAGGIDVFVGTTRRWTDERETTELAYDAYGPMALAEMGRLADEAARRWPVERLVLLHRLGVVPVADASVVVGVATPHRADAFAACRFLIDRLKVQVPVWKKEHYADGTTEWVEGERPPSTDL